MSGIKKQNIALAVFLSIITCGIYNIYWIYTLMKNVHELEHNEKSCVGELLCFMFVPFYSLYWWLKRGNIVNDEFKKIGRKATSSGVLLLILGIFGLSIVSEIIMQLDFNSLSEEAAPASAVKSEEAAPVTSAKKKNKKGVLDYGMEWFDYHMTAGLYISMAISVLLFIFVFLGQFYRPVVRDAFPAVKVLDTIMWIYYLVYTLGLLIARKPLLAEDKISFGLSLLMFIVRAVFHAFVAFYLLFITKGIIGLNNSIFYTYLFYFSILTVVVNIINIIYFLSRSAIFSYEETDI